MNRIVKVKRKRADPPQQCVFLDNCVGACEWCETNDYSEACVPMQMYEIRRLNAELETAMEMLRLQSDRLQRSQSPIYWEELK